MVAGIIQSESSNLTAWIPYVLSRARFAQSKQRRFMRWLNNENIKVDELYRPMIQEALANWGREPMYIALDTSMLWNQYCLIAVHVLYRGRAVPLIWKVIEHESSAVSYAEYADLLKAAAGLLPKGLKIIFLADRGFADNQLMALCRRLNWRFRIRIKSNFTIYQGDKRHSQVQDYVLAAGKSIFLHHVYLTEHKHGPVHLALAHHSQSGEYWYIVSDELTDVYTYKEYGIRFDIEEGFLDEKSNGFDIEHSAIRSEKALTRLFLVLAAATLYLVSQGTQVVNENKRRWVDPHWFRGNSYLRIGWNWVKAAFIQGWQLFLKLCLYGGEDPEPAIASKKQHEKRRKNFDFDCKVLSLKV